MKKHPFAIMLFITNLCFAESEPLPVFQAVEWQDMGETLDYSEAVDSGCSLCCVGEINHQASSTLPTQGNSSYEVNNLWASEGLKTAWVEGAKGNGIGETILTTFAANNTVPVNIEGLFIANGFVKSKNLWQKNSRVKAFKIHLNGKPYGIIQLQDVYFYQKVAFSPILLQRGTPMTLKLEILDVYPGITYQDTAISHLEYTVSGCHH